MGVNNYSGGGKGGMQPAGYGQPYGGSWQPNFYGQNTDYFNQGGGSSKGGMRPPGPGMGTAGPVSNDTTTTGIPFANSSNIGGWGGYLGGAQDPSYAGGNNPGATFNGGGGGKKGGMQPPGFNGGQPAIYAANGLPMPVPMPAMQPASPAAPAAPPAGSALPPPPPVNPAAQQRWDNYYANAAFPSSAPSTVATPPPATSPSGHMITTPAAALSPASAGLGHIVTSPTGNIFKTIAPATTPVASAATPGHGGQGAAVDTTGLSPVQIAQQQYKITDPYKLQMISMGYMNPDGTPK